jgi:hypothetical protein
MMAGLPVTMKTTGGVRLAARMKLRLRRRVSSHRVFLPNERLNPTFSPFIDQKRCTYKQYSSSMALDLRSNNCKLRGGAG